MGPALVARGPGPSLRTEGAVGEARAGPRGRACRVLLSSLLTLTQRRLPQLWEGGSLFLSPLYRWGGAGPVPGWGCRHLPAEARGMRVPVRGHPRPRRHASTRAPGLAGRPAGNGRGCRVPPQARRPCLRRGPATVAEARLGGPRDPVLAPQDSRLRGEEIGPRPPSQTGPEQSQKGCAGSGPPLC